MTAVDRPVIVTGTGTDVGKTTATAALAVLGALFAPLFRRPWN